MSHIVKFEPKTDHWELRYSMFMEYVGPTRTQCNHCHGFGKGSGGFGSSSYDDTDDDTPCKVCNGYGTISIAVASPKPKIPESLVQHMKAAYKDWLENHNKPRRFLKLPGKE